MKNKTIILILIGLFSIGVINYALGWDVPSLNPFYFYNSTTIKPVDNTYGLEMGLINTVSLTVNSAYTLPSYDGTASQVLQTDGSGNVTWATGGVGSGDIEAVGDCATGACFTGTSGTTLTFNNAGGDGTLAYNGTFTFNKDTTITGLLTATTLSDGVLTASAGRIAGATSIASTLFTGALTGNASTATALASNPNDCSANQFANAIVASGNLTCASITDADVPDTITASNYLLLTGGTISGILDVATLTVASTYTLPKIDGTTGQYLKTNGSGSLSWGTPTGSGDMTKAVYDTGANNIVDSAEDLTCTNCINATEIEDIYVLNAGDVITGTLNTATLQINSVYTFPNIDGSNGQALKTNGLGALAWGEDNNTTYTGGDGLTLTGTDFDFDGGDIPGGELGGTWALPTLDNDALDDQYYDSEADLTGLLDNNYVDVTGDTITGVLNVATLQINSAYTFPNTDGTNGYVLKTNGLGALSWQTDTGGIADADYGDITVSGSGTVWNIDADTITKTEIADNFINSLTADTLAAADEFIFYDDTGGTSDKITWTNLMNSITDLGAIATNTTINAVLDVDTLTINTAFTFPSNDGIANYFLKTSGAGVLSWTDTALKASNLAADPADCAAGTAATAIATNGDLTCGITPLISGGTLTSAYHCRYDGTGIDCDRVEDATGACGANAVCMGGHTHPTTEISGVNAGTDLTADLEEEVTEGSLADSTIVSADIKNGTIAIADLASVDFGNFTCNGTTCSIDADSINDTHIDWGTGANQVSIADLSGNQISGAVVWDLGGATSLEIPNAAAGTVDATGEVTLDTTDDQIVFFGASAAKVITSNKQMSLTVESPSNLDAFLFIKMQDGATITNINGIVDPGGSGESAVFDVQECSSTGASCATVDATITADNDGAADDGSFSNGSIDAADWMLLDVGAITGTVSWLTVTINFTTVRE